MDVELPVLEEVGIDVEVPVLEYDGMDVEVPVLEEVKVPISLELPVLE